MNKHFSQEFIEELSRKDDEALFALLGELLQPSAAVEWSDEVCDRLMDIEKAYCDCYSDITNTIDDPPTSELRVLDEEFDYKTGQAGGRYYA